MSKTIRLDDQVHHDLDELRLKRESFSEIVAYLVTFYRDITKVVWSHSAEHPNTPGDRR